MVLALVDGDGNRATRSFEVVLQQFNLPPSIIVGTSTNSIPPTNTLVEHRCRFALRCDGFGIAQDQPHGDRPDRQLQRRHPRFRHCSRAPITTPTSASRSHPRPGVDGVGVVQLTCADTNGNTTTVSFCVMVRPNASVVFVDHFDYNA